MFRVVNCGESHVVEECGLAMAVLNQPWAGAASVHHAHHWSTQSSVFRASCCCRGQRSGTGGLRSSHRLSSNRVVCVQCVANHATRADDSSRIQAQDHEYESDVMTFRYY